MFYKGCMYVCRYIFMCVLISVQLCLGGFLYVHISVCTHMYRHISEILRIQFLTIAISKYHNKVSCTNFFVSQSLKVMFNHGQMKR